MRAIPLLVTALIFLTACHPAHKKALPPLPPRPTITPVKPASITIDPSTGWSAAPTNGGTPLFTNENESFIRFFPPALQGTLLIQRRTGENPDTGFLNGKVTVPTPATLYAAFAFQVNDQTLISEQQFTAFAHEGWTHVSNAFDITEPLTRQTHFQVWSFQIPAGPVVITSEALPNPDFLFLGRPH